jgi:antitoxin component YwqK of YwqJK toxin-antitoxin module
MQKIQRLSILLLFIIPIISSAQDMNQIDDMGRKQGKWRKTYMNGVIKYEGQFKNDRPYGEFKYYYEDAKLQATTRFSDDGIIAHTNSYHENGQPMADGKYINQLRDSTWNFYSDVDGKLISKENYTKGKLNGKSILYYADSGEQAEITNYENGIKNGPYLKYFPDGKIMTEGTYKNDKLEGDFTVYYNDGSIAIKGQYKNGIQTGNWSYFDEDGKPLTAEQFREGKK